MPQAGCLCRVGALRGVATCPIATRTRRIGPTSIRARPCRVQGVAVEVRVRRGPPDLQVVRLDLRVRPERAALQAPRDRRVLVRPGRQVRQGTRGLASRARPAPRVLVRLALQVRRVFKVSRALRDRRGASEAPDQRDRQALEFKAPRELKASPVPQALREQRDLQALEQLARQVL
jgi:hypothetical protein